MSIPSLLQGKLHSVEVLMGAAAAHVHSQVETPIEIQWGDRWCWASVGAGLKAVETNTPAQPQCNVAIAHLHHQDCCQNGQGAKPPQHCDVEAALNEVLDDLSVSSSNASGTIPLPTIRSEIDGKRPVACAIQFPNSYHFVVIDGYLRSGAKTTLIVRDSERGEIRMSYDNLISNYNDEGGTWEWSYQMT